MLVDPLFDRLARALAGRYTVARELGRGGMATVYLGTDVKLGRLVAIKLLAPATRAYLGSDRFQREVLLAAQLSHPHIVPLFEADEADGLLFYVMEYVEGESLRNRLDRQQQLPVGEVVGLAAEVGDALQYAHENGVIHRDIKPENILLSRGHALVTDFGVAKVIEERGGAAASLTGAGIAVGTAAYMSPEQASGDQRIDARSDVYSLAVVLYEMLAGKPPFTGPSAAAITARVISDPPRPLSTLRPNIPVHLEQAIMRGLAKRPADRPPTARAFVETLSTQTEGTDVLATGTEAAPNRFRANKVRLGVSVVVTVALLLALRATFFTRTGSDQARNSMPIAGAPEAVALLLEGQARFWHGNFDGAAAAYRQAIAADSDLALAYHRLSVVETWRWDYPAARRVVESGLARRERLAPLWRDLLEAQRQYVMRNADSAISAFQVLVSDHPRMVDGWYGLGEALFHFGGLAGHTPQEADRVFARLDELDSAFAPIQYHLVELAVLRGDTRRAQRYLARIPLDSDKRPPAEAMVTLAFGDSQTRARVMHALRDADRSTLSLLVAHFGRGALNLPLVDSLAGYLLQSDRTQDDRLRGAQYRLVALAAQGRWHEGISQWETVVATQHLDRWIVLAYLAQFPAQQIVAPMYAWANQKLAHGDIPDFTRPPTDEPQQAFSALVHRSVVQGDSAEVGRLLRRLEAAAPRADPSDPLPPSLRDALRSRLALLSRDTTAALVLLEQSVSRSAEPLGMFFPLMTMEPERWLLAEIYARHGDRERASRWLGSFGNTWSLGDMLYLHHVACLRQRLGAAFQQDVATCVN